MSTKMCLNLWNITLKKMLLTYLLVTYLLCHFFNFPALKFYYAHKLTETSIMMFNWTCLTIRNRDILICCFIWEKMAKKTVTYLLKTKTTKSKFCVWGRNKHICFSLDPRYQLIFDSKLVTDLVAVHRTLTNDHFSVKPMHERKNTLCYVKV